MISTYTKRIYNAEISAGSLMLNESRMIAKLLLKNPDEDAWHKAIIVDNVLQKKAPSSAKRQARLIRNRLELMTMDLLRLVVDGNREVAMQALFAAAIKRSRLLGDFIDEVIRGHIKTFNTQLTLRDWKNYFSDCEQRDDSLKGLSDSTKKKLGQVVFRILAEAKYIDSTRSLNLTPAQVAPEVYSVLANAGEDYVLKCMEVYK
ncbi:MAG TPA: DUF1819 family protein [Nitrospirae bacterium]|nr:DUF1819 family protein [Nitrospirota bacterium]